MRRGTKTAVKQGAHRGFHAAKREREAVTSECICVIKSTQRLRHLFSKNKHSHDAHQLFDS